MAGSPVVVVRRRPAVAAGRTEVVGCSLAEEDSLGYVGELLEQTSKCHSKTIP